MKQELVVLGTGNAQAINYYNTCFALRGNAGTLLVDAGGGNGILMQLEKASIRWQDLREMIVTHAHTDHVLGVVWVVRMVATAQQKGDYPGVFRIWCHEQLAETIRTLCRLTLQKKHFDAIGKTVLLCPVRDGQTEELCGWPVRFFDIHSTKALQYGFALQLHGGKKLCCLGDEPYNPLCEDYVRDCDWLLSEAFCRAADADRYKPYEKHHSTVADACGMAETLGAKNLVIWHTEDDHPDRRALYMAEGAPLYSGHLYVPEDLDRIELG